MKKILSKNRTLLVINRILSAVLILILITSIIPSAFALDYDFATLTDEELINFKNALNDEIGSRLQSSENQYLRYDGTNRVCIYEDDIVSVDFNGMYQWTDDWYIPNIMIKNKMSDSIYFVWDDVFLNGCVVGAANSSSRDEIPAYGRMAFSTVNACSITIKDDFIDVYGDTTLNLFEMSFYIEDKEGKEIDTGRLGCNCSINLIELMNS